MIFHRPTPITSLCVLRLRTWLLAMITAGGGSGCGCGVGDNDDDGNHANNHN